MANNKVLLKKSAVPNRVPQTDDLDFGEIALNYADGQIYYKNPQGVITPLLTNVTPTAIRPYQYIGDGVTTTFEAIHFLNHVLVYVDGILVQDGIDYDSSNPTTITFVVAPANGADINIMGFEKLEFVDFSAAGLGLTYDEVNHVYILASATSADPNTVVYRDANGDFAANVITADRIVTNQTLETNSVAFDGTIMDSTETSTAGTTPTTLFSLPAADYRSFRVTAQATSGTDYQVIEILSIHDGTNVFTTQYANLVSNFDLGQYEFVINNGSVEFIVTPTLTDPTTFKIVFTALPTT